MCLFLRSILYPSDIHHCTYIPQINFLILCIGTTRIFVLDLTLFCNFYNFFITMIRLRAHLIPICIFGGDMTWKISSITDNSYINNSFTSSYIFRCGFRRHLLSFCFLFTQFCHLCNLVIFHPFRAVSNQLVIQQIHPTLVILQQGVH